MPKILTKAYGEIEVSSDTKIHFVQPIFGFENYRDFYLLEMKEIEGFYWLQSADEQSLAFVVLNPRLFLHDYVLDIDEADYNLLEVEGEDQVDDLSIANIPEDPAMTTINLLGPLVFNSTKCLAIQAVSNVKEYGTKYAIFKKETVK